jgi:hypothetical protein
MCGAIRIAGDPGVADPADRMVGDRLARCGHVQVRDLAKRGLRSEQREEPWVDRAGHREVHRDRLRSRVDRRRQCELLDRAMPDPHLLSPCVEHSCGRDRNEQPGRRRRGVRSRHVADQVEQQMRTTEVVEIDTLHPAGRTQFRDHADRSGLAGTDVEVRGVGHGAAQRIGGDVTGGAGGHCREGADDRRCVGGNQAVQVDPRDRTDRGSRS